MTTIAIDPVVLTNLIVTSFSTGDVLPTPEEVERRVDDILAGPAFSSLNGQRKELVDEVLRRLTTRVGNAKVLENDEGHEEWLNPADKASWKSWARLREYLESVKRFPQPVLSELDRSTDYVLGKLESPKRAGRWDRRGLVLGHVQSGKTTHYAALAGKALDAGYEIVIILAGIHNSLRSQTHERVDHLVIGRDSARFIEMRAGKRREPGMAPREVGVGERDVLLGRIAPPAVITFTSSAEEGDFKQQVAQQIGMDIGGTRLVLVVKKNATILENLIRWFESHLRDRVGEGTRRHDVPTLVIDDEADHASINTNPDPEADPRRINGLIRRLLLQFDKVGFVGYTATPFANIFISNDVDHDRFGKDLFPEHFILSLESPDDYVGPAVVFGQPGDDTVGIPERNPLPMFVDVSDADVWMPAKHKRTHEPGPLPPSLKEAVQLFVLACAVRCCRGSIDVHNSMLVHVTRFVDVQERVHRLITQEVKTLAELVTGGSTKVRDEIESKLEELWEREFVQKHPAFIGHYGERGIPLPSWSSVWDYVPEVLGRVKVFKINGSSTDALIYSKATKGLYAIAVGGDKLSRGLTLEGLSVSYFLRTSRMYDTLMQMGRWFGYRPGYVDLCRVYTPEELKDAFREISLAMEELRNDLAYMADAGLKPKDFGLRIRTPPDGLLITAPDRMRQRDHIQVKFAGELVQTLDMPRGKDGQAKQNRDAVADLIRERGAPERTVRGERTSHFIWHGIDVEDVLTFLSSYQANHSPCFMSHCEGVRKYIRQQVTKGELRQWAVAIVSREEREDAWTATIAGHAIPLVTRKRAGDEVQGRFVTQGVVGSAEEALDLNATEYAAALEATRRLPKGDPEAKFPKRQVVRAVRPESRGLMLIYPIADHTAPENWITAVALSFPEKLTGGSVEYTVNQVWLKQRGLFDDWEDND